MLPLPPCILPLNYLPSERCHAIGLCVPLAVWQRVRRRSVIGVGQEQRATNTTRARDCEFPGRRVAHVARALRAAGETRTSTVDSKGRGRKRSHHLDRCLPVTVVQHRLIHIQHGAIAAQHVDKGGDDVGY